MALHAVGRKEAPAKICRSTSKSEKASKTKIKKAPAGITTSVEARGALEADSKREARRQVRAQVLRLEAWKQ